MDENFAWFLGTSLNNESITEPSFISNCIKGNERHFIRGILDIKGSLSYRSGRNSLRVSINNESFDIVDWCSKTICKELKLEYKLPKYKEKDHIYIIEWEGRVANLIAWWLYHGSMEKCCLQRKYNYYKQYVLNNRDLTGEEELFYAISATKEDNRILPNINASLTLKWCHIIQALVKYNTVPIFKNKGKTKYYFLHVPV